MKAAINHVESLGFTMWLGTSPNPKTTKSLITVDKIFYRHPDKA